MLINAVRVYCWLGRATLGGATSVHLAGFTGRAFLGDFWAVFGLPGVFVVWIREGGILGAKALPGWHIQSLRQG